MIKDQVSIIIPCYNKANTVARAIQSAATQTYKNIEVIVVDDGSADDSQQVILSTIEKLKYHNVRNYFIDNGGVANARNFGILASSGEFVCCLDGDDWIEPTFIEKCVNELVKDRTLGIAYTGLRWHDPFSGQSGIGGFDENGKGSVWPIPMNYDRQFWKPKQNCIATCCVFRREGFDRVGGYRQRYAPKGAGSEDAAFWTAIIATGYKAKKVTDDLLFNYQTGGSTSQAGYVEPNWSAFYPWIRTENYPFCAPNTPKKSAHVVRDYSEPIISVVIPVGADHSKYLVDCIDSIEAQEFWQWEIILVDDTEGQDVDGLWFMKAYPFVKILKTGGGFGAGVARNLGASKAKGNFLFFLDADDMLNPDEPRAFNKMLDLYRKTKSAVYTAYLGRSIIPEESIGQLDRQLQKNIVARDGDDTWIYHQVYDYNCGDAIKQPSQDQAGNVYVWCNVSTLIPRSWHNEIGGFDEAMDTWEDIDYWWRMAKAGKCFDKLDEPVLIYRFYSGVRRNLAHKEIQGIKKWQSVVNYLSDKHERISAMGCNCGNKKQKQAVLPAALINSETSELRMADSDYVKVTFHFAGSETRGTYGRVLRSPTGKRLPDGKLMQYGPGGGYGLTNGMIITVHKDDQAARPDMFKLVEAEIPQPQPEPTIAPVPVAVESVKQTPPPPVLAAELDLSTLGLNTKQVASLKKGEYTTTEAIQALGLEGLKALDGFGAVSATKLLKAL